MAMMARLLDMSRSTVYAAGYRGESEHQQRDTALGERIEALFEKHHKRYGSPRIHRTLVDEGWVCGRHRVARLMRERGLRARYRNRHTPRLNRMTQLDSVVPNLLERCFTVAEPNRVWLGDITQFPTREGWLYLAANMELCSRLIIGWSMSNRYDVNLVISAIDQAYQSRGEPEGVIVHNDQGSQYRAGEYRAYLKQCGLQPSMSAKGDCWDNAPMESFFKSLKTELGDTRGLHEAQLAARLIEYIEKYYNQERLHSAIGYLSPIEYERRLGA